MILFNSDLDNTLIYSHKYGIGDSKKCVEIYQGREISFMTPYSYKLLKLVNKMLCFVPTTTRSMEQYQRLHLGIGIPRFALVSNGGILLVDGLIDDVWYNESQKLVLECESELNLAATILESDENRCFETRRVDGLFIFTKSSKPMQTADRLQKLLDTSKVDVLCNGTKVYILPQKLNKGRAVKRLKDRLEADYVIVAGDSEFDVSMITQSDKAVVPGILAENLTLQKNIVFFSGQRIFSDEVLDYIEKLMAGKQYM